MGRAAGDVGFRGCGHVFEQAFKNIDDVLWKEAGCTTELDYTEQTSWLLFLKYLDGLEQDRADQAALEGRTYVRLVKGLPGGYSTQTEREDAFVREHVQIDPISETEYRAGIDAVAGRCACGGKFTLTAPPAVLRAGPRTSRRMT